MKQVKLLFLATFTLFLLNSCKKDDGGGTVDTSAEVTINLISPEGIEISEFSETTIKFTEINTGTVTNETVTTSTFTVTLEQGSYEVNVDGNIVYTFNSNELEGAVTAYENQVSISQAEESVEIQLTLKSLQNDLIIEEIFFTGTLTPEGDQYYGDQYFKIYNNTDDTLYADGLLLADSAFMTVDQQEYTPDVMSEAFTASAVLKIPGSGQDYPIASGTSIIIAYSAIDHTENNANSINLTSADFEFYYESLDDVDNPSVPNLINLYDRLIPHNRGYKSYVIARLPEGVTDETFLAENSYTYNWDFVFNGVTYPMDGDGVKIPNEYIVDAVNLSVESEYQWIVTDASLDSGWTYCGTVDSDANRYGKSVIRKVITSESGMNILQDTNNSTVDFTPEAAASLLN